MNLGPVVLAIPMYFTLMAVELIAEGITKKHTYRINDAVTNISTGVLQQLAATFLQLLRIGFYILVYERLAPWHLPANWISFALLFVLWDLCYYWDHRLQHRISLFWGAHSVHHQSEEYNLSVALRQSSTSVIWGFPLYLPLALLGFDPTQFAIVGGLNLLYQFWIHTEHIHRMPAWFEWIFNTPSHHRVHHARDPKYLDKNYGGVFIVFDRWFGSFQAEEEKPHYGVTKPLNSWNPVYANFAHYLDLAGYVRQARSMGDALRILFYPPGWLPDYLGGFQEPPPVDDRTLRKYDVHPAFLRVQLYILSQFVAALLVNSYYFFNAAHFSGYAKIGAAAWIVFTTLMFGWLFEKRGRWIGMLEWLRLFVLPIGLMGLQEGGMSMPGWMIPLAWSFAGLSLLIFLWWIWPVRRMQSQGEVGVVQ
ncbi:MAG: sterol desaturase family protein [Haliscomenobacter sp.]